MKSFHQPEKLWRGGALVFGVLTMLQAPARAALPELIDPLAPPAVEKAEAEDDGEHDPSSRVAILGYHRFGPRSTDPLLIGVDDLEEQIHELHRNGLEVISMDDFLAWRAGEKNIPAESAIVTIDDGFRSIHEFAHPVFTDLDVPYTVFIYTDYVNNGGAAITWDLLRELRDAGVDIGSHSKSHGRLAGEKTMEERGADTPTFPPMTEEDFFSHTTFALSPLIGGAPQMGLLAEWSHRGLTRNKYEEWVWNELTESKRVLEKELEITVRTFSYPYGIYSDRVAELARFAGYEAMFTVNGDEVNALTEMHELHRYIVHSDDPANFLQAMRFRTAEAEPEADPPLPEKIIVSPAKNAEVPELTPVVFVELGEMGDIDTESLQMRISGIGVVPAIWDAAQNRLSYQPEAALRNRTHTVVVTGKVGEESFVARWSFSPGQPVLAQESARLNLSE